MTHQTTHEAEAAATRRRADAAAPDTAATHPVLALQQQLGNAQVTRMLAQRDPAPEVGPEGGPVSDATAARIDARRGGGSTLDDGTRATMEQSFGASFDDVRIHTDHESQTLNHSLGARAFTTGNDIFFGQDASAADRHLLAHELTHVVQQRSMAATGPMTVGAAGDAYEQEADTMARKITGGT